MSLLTLTFPKSRRPIVLIGAGGIVRDAHLPAYRKSGFPVASIFDTNRERARGLAGSFGIACVTTSLEDGVFDFKAGLGRGETPFNQSFQAFAP